MIEWIADPSAWAGLFMLVLLEVVLGIDNLVFIAILADKLPPHQRHKARVIGLSLARHEGVFSGLNLQDELEKATAAERLARSARLALGLKGEIAARLGMSLIEHWREEAPLLARRADVERFCHEVDELRDASARLQKRLERLS